MTESANEFVRRQMREDAIRREIENRFSPIALLPEDLLHLFTPESLAAVRAINHQKETEMKRAEVYSAIDGERDYQLLQWGKAGLNRGGPGGDGDVAHEVGAWLTFMRHYMNLADTATATSHDDTPCLHMIRKVVALGVACLEQHGCPRRAGH